MYVCTSICIFTFVNEHYILNSMCRNAKATLRWNAVASLALIWTTNLTGQPTIIFSSRRLVRVARIIKNTKIPLGGASVELLNKLN